MASNVPLITAIKTVALELRLDEVHERVTEDGDSYSSNRSHKIGLMTCSIDERPSVRRGQARRRADCKCARSAPTSAFTFRFSSAVIPSLMMKFLRELAVVFAIFGLASLATPTTNAIAAAGPTSARVRKSWSAFTPTEQATYLRAVQTAMEKGYQYRFAAVHADIMNVWHAHNTCGFLLWHRRFLLAYENMLRGLGDEFAQVTLPYWNYFEDSTKQLATKVPCTSIQACSKYLQDFGGGSEPSDISNRTSQKIGKFTVRNGKCVSRGLAGHACANPNGEASGACDHCIMRAQWSNETNILQTVGTDFLSMLAVFSTNSQSSDAHSALSRAIETTYHDAVHDALAGAMTTMGSAFDPVFFGHHATVDMALYVFNHCRYDPTNSIDIDANERDTAFDLFAGCAVRDGKNRTIDEIRPDSNVYMNLDNVPVSQANETKDFFASLDGHFRTYIDSEALGSFSYYYQLDPYLKTLLESHQVKCPSYVWTKPPSASRSLTATTSAHDAAQEVTATLAECGRELVDRDATVTLANRLEQEGALKCEVIRRKCTVQDYSSEFKKMMHIADDVKPYCLTLMNRVDAGELEIVVSEKCKQRYGELTGVNLV